MKISDETQVLVLITMGILLGFLAGIVYGAYNQLEYQKEELYHIAISNNTLISDGRNVYNVKLLNQTEIVKEKLNRITE